MADRSGTITVDGEVWMGGTQIGASTIHGMVSFLDRVFPKGWAIKGGEVISTGLGISDTNAQYKGYQINNIPEDPPIERIRKPVKRIRRERL